MCSNFTPAGIVFFLLAHISLNNETLEIKFAYRVFALLLFPCFSMIPVISQLPSFPSTLYAFTLIRLL